MAKPLVRDTTTQLPEELSSGDLALPANPTTSLGAATKQYVDAVGAGSIVSSSTTATSVSNTTTQGNILSFTVPGGTLGAGKSLRVHMIGTLLNNSGSSAAVQFGISYGGTTLWTDTTTAQTASVTVHPIDFEFTLCGAGSTSSQLLSGSAQMGTTAATATGHGDLAAVIAAATGFATPVQGTSSIDSTADQTLAVFVKFAAASALLTATCAYYNAFIDGVGAKGDTGATGSPGAAPWVQMTQAAYNALSPPDSGTLYVIVG